MLHEASGWEFKELNDSHLFRRWPAGTAVPSGLSTAISGSNWWMPLIQQMVTLLPTFPATSRYLVKFSSIITLSVQIHFRLITIKGRIDTDFDHFSLWSASNVSHGFIHLCNLDFPGPPLPSGWPSELKLWYSEKSHFPCFLLTVVCYLTGSLRCNPNQ